MVFAFAYNAIGIPGGAGVLYPTFGILLSLVVAALAMSLSSVPVIANVLRLRATPLWQILRDRVDRPQASGGGSRRAGSQVSDPRRRRCLGRTGKVEASSSQGLKTAAPL